MKAKPIYVELPIRADMDKLWRYTQTPELHQQWDLRFSEIAYLPRRADETVQRFLYRTRIGFGLNIAGTGEARAQIAGPGGERLSTLRFGSEQPISLIREGGGYWRYKPQGDCVVFSTRFDYRTRFGTAGRLFDRLLFRPLFGYATAWSFDALRIWLERGIPPAATIRKALVHYICVALLALLWLYQGLVPKLLFPGTWESALLEKAGLPVGLADGITAVLGVFEIGTALLAVLRHRSRRALALLCALPALLCAPALCVRPDLTTAPFGPVPLSLSMIGLGLLASLTLGDLPDAGRCARKPGESASSAAYSSGGTSDGIDL